MEKELQKTEKGYFEVIPEHFCSNSFFVIVVTTVGINDTMEYPYRPNFKLEYNKNENVTHQIVLTQLKVEFP